jgi:hypothetical protein
MWLYMAVIVVMLIYVLVKLPLIARRRGLGVNALLQWLQDPEAQGTIAILRKVKRCANSLLLVILVLVLIEVIYALLFSA